MQQKPILWILFCFLTYSGWAQPNLEVIGKSPDLYLQHTVEAKETWYSLGRLYNLTPKEIGPFNQLDINTGLKIGQQVKIPLVAANFTQNERKAADEVLVPVYHRVVEGEWMFRVSVNHNKVELEKLEKWNGITRNDIRPAMELVVGFLKVKKALSALSGKAVSQTAAAQQPTTTQQPIASQPAASKQPKAPIEPAREKEPVTTTKPAEQSSLPPAAQKQEPGSNSGGSIDFNGGFFKAAFKNGSKTASGVANIFRSTSGWKDGKYYALMDKVAVGTIVQVRHTGTNKVIYAKVLGRLSDIKENAGLAIRISNAAAAELGGSTTDAKFSVEINY